MQFCETLQKHAHKSEQTKQNECSIENPIKNFIFYVQVPLIRFIHVKPRKQKLTLIFCIGFVINKIQFQCEKPVLNFTTGNNLTAKQKQGRKDFINKINTHHTTQREGGQC